MQEFEIKADDGTRYTFSFENMFNHLCLNIKRWHYVPLRQPSAPIYVEVPLRRSSAPIYVEFTRPIVEGEIIWMDIPGLQVDHFPPEVRHYMGRIVKNLAFT